MDRRGLTYDPNADTLASTKWHQQIGPTRKPSPYATAAWSYAQNFQEVLVEVESNQIIDVLDNGTDFRVWLFPNSLYDGGLFTQINFPRDYEDSGLYSSTSATIETIKQIFASVKVYDSKASDPTIDDTTIEIAELAIDSDGVAVDTEITVEPDDFFLFDNGSNFQLPIPNQSLVYDSGSFAQQGLGISLDGGTFRIENGGMIFFDSVSVVYVAGASLAANGAPNNGDLISVTRTSIQSDDTPPGKLLGRVDFEVKNCEVIITDWSHQNWQDDTPVRKAVKRMVNSLPSDITKISVTDRPSAFWTSLGFVKQSKDDDTLVYSDPLAHRSY